MAIIRLDRAPSDDKYLSTRRFLEFLEAHPNPFVSARPESLIHSAIDDDGLFFVETDEGQLIATTGFYRHNDGLAELGSTLVDEAFQGCRLQAAIYHHIIALKWLAEMISCPTDVMAIVDERAAGSYKNIERCGFRRHNSIPDFLREALPARNWRAVETAEKRLYLLPRESIALNLLYVASQGQQHPLTNHQGATVHRLQVDFPYFGKPNALQSLRDEAQRLMVEGK